METLTQSSDCQVVQFAYADLTAQEGNIWDALKEFLADQQSCDARSYMYAGAGSVAWIRNGRVVDWTLNAADFNEKYLARRTVELLGCARSNDE